MGNTYLIKWQNSDAIGSVDIISDDFFSSVQEGRVFTHGTVAGGRTLVSTFDIVRDGKKSLIFRFGGKNQAANDAQGIFIGDMRIIPSELETATEIEWRSDSSDVWLSSPVKIKKVAALEGIRKNNKKPI